jgi:CubicO group peptidase (beta-lactamase class C family)
MHRPASHQGRFVHRTRPNPIAIAFIIVFASSLALSCSSSTGALREPGAPVSREAAIARFSSFVPSEMRARGIAGLGIVVADEKGTIWSSGFGIADKATGRKFDSSTISNIGSVSKIFTATAIMRLVQEGKIDLDASVSSYLPDFAPKAGGYDPKAVTVRSLLTHHSGLQSDVFAGFITGSEKPEGYPRPYANNVRLASETTLCAPSGEVFSYSNLGYSLLGLIVEKVSGESFADYERETIFEPLGMNSSSFLIEDRFAGRYARNPADGGKSGIPYIRDMPAGSLNVSADDMGRFLSAVMAQGSGVPGGILGPEAQAEMWKGQNVGCVFDGDFSIGLCYWIMSLRSLPGERLVGHGGDLNNYHALLIVDPARKLGVFVMVNSAKGLGSIALEGIATEAARDFGGLSGGPLFAPETPQPGETVFPAGLAQKIQGDYSSMQGLIRMKASGDRLAAKVGGNWLDCYYRTDGSIGLRVKILGIKLPVPGLKEISITPESVGNESAFALRGHGIFLGMALKARPEAVPKSWLGRQGAWIPVAKENAPMIDGAWLSLDKRSGLFLVTVSTLDSKEAFPVRAVSDTELRTLGKGRNLGMTISVSGPGKAEVIKLFGVELKRR